MPTYSPTTGITYPMPEVVRYCSRCVMPNTRPRLHVSAEMGICDACARYEGRASIDWASRWHQLEVLADRYRRKDGTRYDCLIPVSSGRDSFYATATMVERLGMHPLLASVGNWSGTDTGRHNAEVLSDTFGCDLIRLELPRKPARVWLRKAFDRNLAPMWYWDRAVYTWPLLEAMQRRIKLVIYGENISWEYGGHDAQDTMSAMSQGGNRVVIPVELTEWLGDGIETRHLIPLREPRRWELEGAHVNPIYLSYFEPWDGVAHMERAKERGWHDLGDEWHRQGLCEDYDQIDTVGYNVHPWLKFPKFAHQHQSDVLSGWVRSGMISREDAVERVLKAEHVLDPRMLEDFLSFTGITEAEFWSTVDLWANRRLLRKVGDTWRLRPETERALREGGVVG